jgi:hypothetical protein
VLGLYADTIRSSLGIRRDLKMLFGMSFGYADYKAQANQSRMGRDPFPASVTFHN